jgi:hypothetical protein
MDDHGPAETDCLSRIMRQAGHALNWGCDLCAFNCTYAPPCGCGSHACVDLAVGEERGRLSAAA